MSTLFNTFLDNLLAACGRILELPLFFSLAAIGIAGFVVLLAIRHYSKKGSSAARDRALLWAGGAFAILAVILVVDRKIARLQTAVTELRAKMSSDTTAVLNIVSKLEARNRSLMFNPEDVQKLLAPNFGDVTVQPMICDAATDFARVVTKLPLTQICVAVIDLQHPAVEVRLGVGLDKKTLTSAFAHENDCTVAINGEAGESPGLNSGLGNWKGNLVWQGKVLLRESAKFPAPFLCFDRQNHAAFVPAASPNRTLGPDMYNVIWGRQDVLVNGVLPKSETGVRYPRTGMGINREGTRLYLLVADGRQPGYSMGLTLTGIGQCLQAFGAYNAMACDEGGSSCMYLKQFGGIVNIPSDNIGQERPMYTHFGIKLRLETKLDSPM